MGEEVVPAIVEGYANQVIDASLFGGKILKKISLQILALLVCSSVASSTNTNQQQHLPLSAYSRYEYL